MEKNLFPKKIIEGDFIDFLNNVHNITVIISLGSCDCSRNKGKYHTLMYYNDKVKVLEGDITTNSANRCILEGLIAAVDCIRKPTDIYLVTGCPLGFHSPRGHNRDLCEQLYMKIVVKDCMAEIIEITHNIDALKEFVRKKACCGNSDFL